MASASLILFVIVSCFFTSSIVVHAQNDTLKQGQLLRDYEQLISASRRFRLGFFSTNAETGDLGSAGPRYLGIWFDRIPVYSVWVGNRESPVPDSSGALTIDKDGFLKIIYQRGSPIVINPNILKEKNTSGSMTASLLDSGNLVVRQVSTDGTTGSVLWQSFDYPHNILLPGMKLGMDLKTGQNWSLTSWSSDKIPAPGAFRLGLDPSGANQMLVWRRGEIYWSSGVWQNGSFPSAPHLTRDTDHIYDFRFVATDKERYFTYSVKNESTLSRWDLDTLGVVTLLTHTDGGSWRFMSASPCNYDAKNSSAVCLSEKPSKCRNRSQGFLPKRGYLDYSGFLYYSFNQNLTLSDCHAQCWKNCFCGAYSASGSDGIGCQFWKKGTKFTPDDRLDFVYLLSDL